MTTIETTIISDCLAQIERDRQAIAQAISKMHESLDADFERYLWDRLNWQGRKLRQAESVITDHAAAACVNCHGTRETGQGHPDDARECPACAIEPEMAEIPY